MAEEGKPERWIPDDSETRGKPDGMCVCQPWFYLRLVAYSFFRLSEGA